MTTTAEFHKIGIVGGGMMGIGIAEACVAAGLNVRVKVSTQRSIRSAQQRLGESLDQQVRRNSVSKQKRDELIAGIDFTLDIEDLKDRDCVIEAVTEHEDTKLSVFAALDKIVESPHAILASTTSSIPIIRLAQTTNRPGQVIGLHFFSPVPIMRLVEIVRSLLTDSATFERAEAFVTKVLGKEAISSPDRAGFLVNFLLVPYVLTAVRMLEAGVASAEAIDKGMTLGCGHPLGPLRLADLVGLDLLLSVANVLYEEYKEPQYVPPPLLLRLVEAGYLGKKTGRGFHYYY